MIGTIDVPTDLDEAFGSGGFRRDPYPVYERLRDLGPLVRSARHRTHFITTHAAVGAVLRAREATVDSPFRASRVLFGRTVMDVDGVEHTRLRSLTNRSFSASAIPGYLEEIVPGVVHAIVDELAGSAVIDAVGQFANQVPIRVMAQIIGLRADHVRDFQTCSDAVIAFLDSASADSRRAAMDAWGRMRVLLYERIAELRPAPDGSVIGQLLAASEAERVDDDEIVRQVGLLIPAAIDTSNRLIANALHTLCRHPAILRRVQDQPEHVAAVVEETLRFEPPIHSTVRIWGGGELLGADLPRGTLLTILLGSANRDPEVFAEPDRFDPWRSGNTRHIAFGAGRHQCMGRRMALAEVTTALTIVLQRCPDLRAVDGATDPIEGLSFRSPVRLLLEPGRVQ
jgi:pulcherriminic acid synthase